MTISEAQRFDMHRGLRDTLGDNVADTLMEHLPPTGWGDVARTRDIDRLEGSFHRLENRFDLLENHFDLLEGRVERLENRIERLEGRVERLENRIEQLENRFERLEVRVERLEARFELLHAEFYELRSDLTRRLDSFSRWAIGLAITYGTILVGILTTIAFAR